jgi:hypothetical protein
MAGRSTRPRASGSHWLASAMRIMVVPLACLVGPGVAGAAVLGDGDGVDAVAHATAVAAAV